MKQMKSDGTVTVNFAFPGTNVVAELITKENPMTPERARKIEALRISGYKVIVWTEDDFRTPEIADQTMLNLRKELGMDTDPKEWDRYKDKRHQLLQDLL